MPDILITEFMDEAAVAELAAEFDVDYAPDLVKSQAEIPGRLEGARALIVRNRTQVTADLLTAGAGLTCVGRLGVGLDNIDVAACKARGVAVYPATGANTVSVSEYVISTAMMLLRGAYRSKHAMLAGRWPREQLTGREIAGRTLGLIGYGAIAQDTAMRAAALGCRVVAHDPFVPEDDPAWQRATRVSLVDLLGLSDIVSLHVPLTDGTRHLIDGKALAAMKPDAILVNAARGGIVDEAALAEALHGGKLGGAALDVFETEPLTAEAAAKFKGLDDLILTPHIAGVTEDSNVRVSGMIAGLVREHLTKQGEA